MAPQDAETPVQTQTGQTLFTIPGSVIDIVQEGDIKVAQFRLAGNWATAQQPLRLPLQHGQELQVGESYMLALTKGGQDENWQGGGQSYGSQR